MSIDLQKAIGITPGKRETPSRDPFLLEYANLKLASLGQPIFGTRKDYPVMRLAHPLLRDYQEKNRLLAGYLCPVDARIQSFIDRYLGSLDESEPRPRLPSSTFTADRHGLARMLSLPPDKDHFASDIIDSYRLHQGVLHNPKSDRRTTQGVFHVAEGGLPIPADKLAVPKVTFARMLERALQPPSELMQLPFTASQEEKAELWVSLLLRPVVCPAVPGAISEKRYEVRFFAPGNLVSNLDFVESIFGNAGDPYLGENDAALDVDGWTGHSGCVILAPHLIRCTKKELGLPNIADATERQKRDKMCWEKEDELYNGGGAFKLTTRDASGVVVTIIADNYFGYCKKEVKTQISFSANLYGLTEEEHSGGAIAFPSYDLGEDFILPQSLPDADYTFDDFLKRYGDSVNVTEEGYAVDKTHPDILFVPEDAAFSLQEQSVKWERGGKQCELRLRPGVTYVLPSGYKVEMVRRHSGQRWRLIGITAEGTFCHKPCTVSGGGKSEISKSIGDAMIFGPAIVADYQKDFDFVEEIIDKEYGERFKDESKNRKAGRPLLSPARSLGSVVKLLTPSPEYKPDYNTWLKTIPFYIKELVFIVKRFYKEDWGKDWRSRFNVDLVNGTSGNELKYRNGKLVSQYLRVGYTAEGAWRTFGLRKDFSPAFKLQLEDDITASAVFPVDQVDGLPAESLHPSVKLALNCEYRLFQRPDDAIHRGYDKRTESDMSLPGNFFSNYAPLTREQAQAIVDDTIRFDQYTDPIKELIRDFLAKPNGEYLSLPSHPRIVDGKPTKNPRYLQDRDDLVDPRSFYLGQLGLQLNRKLPLGAPAPMPVNAVLPGRRNNPPEDGIRPLAVFNPLHYLPLPEFFMEVVSSMTGKSPSTTGAGSEGALTKGPFNALPPVVDLNNALVSFLLTGYPPFISAAGYVGPKCRVDHDISLLVPELWCRMRGREQEPAWLIEEEMLEKCEDIEHKGKTIPGSMLGYRITEKFVIRIFGRMFANPAAVFTPEMLRPETQDLDIFADGMDNIMATHHRVAGLYFEDGSIEGAIPPLKALLHIMKDGNYEGKGLEHPDIRALFTRESVIESDWYQERLACRQKLQVARWENALQCLNSFNNEPSRAAEAKMMDIPARIDLAKHAIAAVQAKAYLGKLSGTLGTDPYLHG